MSSLRPYSQMPWEVGQPVSSEEMTISSPVPGPRSRLHGPSERVVFADQLADPVERKSEVEQKRRLQQTDRHHEELVVLSPRDPVLGRSRMGVGVPGCRQALSIFRHP